MTEEYETLVQDMNHLRQLRHDYDCACNAYVAELLKMWQLDAYYGYWIADEVGGVYAYDAIHHLSMEDIILCVHRSVREEDVLTWEDYILSASEFGLTTPNLRAWLDGCPRTSEEKFAEFRRLKAGLEKAIEQEKQAASPVCGDFVATPTAPPSSVAAAFDAATATVPSPSGEARSTPAFPDDGSQAEPPAEHPGEVVITTAPPTFDNNPY